MPLNRVDQTALWSSQEYHLRPASGGNNDEEVGEGKSGALGGLTEAPNPEGGHGK